LWTNRYGGPGLSGGMRTAVAVDSGGDTFVTGYLYSYGGDSNYEYATVAYSNDGVLLWTNRYNGLANGADYAERIAVANDGSVIVMGYSWNGRLVSGYLSYDYVIIKYSSSVTPYLAIQQLDDQIVHNWTNSIFGLQIAPLITGTFTNLFGATSPYTKPLTGPQQYFRLAAPQ